MVFQYHSFGCVFFLTLTLSNSFPFVHQKPLKLSMNHLCDKLVFVVFWFHLACFLPMYN